MYTQSGPNFAPGSFRGAPRNRVFIKNIKHVSDASLIAQFSCYGAVFDFERQGEPGGWRAPGSGGHSGFFSMDSPEAMEACIRNESGRVCSTPDGNRVIRLSRAKRHQSDPNPPLHFGGPGEGQPFEPALRPLGAPGAPAPSPLPPAPPPPPPASPTVCVFAEGGAANAAAARLQQALASRGTWAVVQETDPAFGPHAVPPHVTPEVAAAWGLRCVLCVAGSAAEAPLAVTLTPEAAAAWERAPEPPPGSPAQALRVLRGVRILGTLMTPALAMELLAVCEAELAGKAARAGEAAAAAAHGGWPGAGPPGGERGAFPAGAAPPFPRGGRLPRRPEDSATLFVLGVHKPAAREDVADAFARLGFAVDAAPGAGARRGGDGGGGGGAQIAQVRLPEHRSGDRRGFAVVEFYDAAAAREARARSAGTLLVNGRPCTVVFEHEGRATSWGDGGAGEPGGWERRGGAAAGGGRDAEGRRRRASRSRSRSPRAGGGGRAARGESRGDRSWSPPGRRRFSPEPPRRWQDRKGSDGDGSQGPPPLPRQAPPPAAPPPAAEEGDGGSTVAETEDEEGGGEAARAAHSMLAAGRGGGGGGGGGSAPAPPPVAAEARRRGDSPELPPMCGQGVVVVIGGVRHKAEVRAIKTARRGLLAYKVRFEKGGGEEWVEGASVEV
jgi:hypothetical protein